MLIEFLMVFLLSFDNCVDFEIKGPIIIEQFARWTVLAWLLTFRTVSKPLRAMYPDMISLQRAGMDFIRFKNMHLSLVDT